MQDRQEADRGAEVLGVGRDLAQGAGGGAEEQAVQQAAVLQGERGEFGGQREHDMEVLAVEQFGPAFGEPLVAGGSLALGAVAAGAVADTAVPAVVALFHEAAEGGAAALLDSRHDLALQGAERAPATGAEVTPVAAEDVGELEPRAGQQVERAGRGADPRASDRQVAGGGGEAAVAEQHLDGAHIDAVLQQMDGESVPE